MAYYCYWEWPPKVTSIYEEALRRLDGNSDCLKFGPARTVWEDEDFENAQWCLDSFDKNRGDLKDEELAVVRWSLEELLKLSEDDLNAIEWKAAPLADGQRVKDQRHGRIIQ